MHLVTAPDHDPVGTVEFGVRALMHRAHPLVTVGRCILDGFHAVDCALVDGRRYGFDILAGHLEQTAGVEPLFRIVCAAAGVEHDLAVLRLTQPVSAA